MQIDQIETKTAASHENANTCTHTHGIPTLSYYLLLKKLDRNSTVPATLIFLFDVVCLSTLTQIHLYDMISSDVVYSTEYRNITVQDRKGPLQCLLVYKVNELGRLFR